MFHSISLNTIQCNISNNKTYTCTVYLITWICWQHLFSYKQWKKGQNAVKGPVMRVLNAQRHITNGLHMSIQFATDQLFPIYDILLYIRNLLPFLRNLCFASNVERFNVRSMLCQILSHHRQLIMDISST